MADNGAPTYPVIMVTDTGAPPGCVNVHDQATGQTVQAPATQEGYLQAIRDLNRQ